MKDMIVKNPSLVNPHGREKRLNPLLLSGAELEEEREKAKALVQLRVTPREAGDLIMMGIGGFTPLSGFMGYDDWKGVCAECKLADGTFWPIPITVSATEEQAGSVRNGEEVAIVSGETSEIIATMKVTEKYTIDKEFECKQVFRTTDIDHPGVRMVVNQAGVNFAGPLKVLSEGIFPKRYPEIYLKPSETREIFKKKGWSTVAALQLRNPMHRAHEYLAKIAIEICDGVLIHHLLGKLEAVDDVPASVTARAISVLIDRYFVEGTCVHAGYPLDMRYAGPREALLHAVFRQNYGCSHLIIGRNHAGIDEYYGPFDAQKIFDDVSQDALEIRPLKIVDRVFYCLKCDGMASVKTCPHVKEDRIVPSGTKIRKVLSEGGVVPPRFIRAEVLEVLREYYAGLTEEERDHVFSVSR
ncbi:sulfate adenylyltransferase [Thermodesulfovibrionales bacterium]|nr:sulfate adenylyltransferase [Thermodesulfovibrionales bacterium]